jgi:hypothetical protein
MAGRLQRASSTWRSHRSAVSCPDWISADQVARIYGDGYFTVPRVVELSTNPQQWPSRLRLGVDSRGSDFYFGLLEGSPIIAPPGITWTVGHGSRYG